MRRTPHTSRDIDDLDATSARGEQLGEWDDARPSTIVGHVEAAPRKVRRGVDSSIRPRIGTGIGTGTGTGTGHHIGTGIGHHIGGDIRRHIGSGFDAQRPQQHGAHGRGAVATGGEVGERDGSVTLGEPLTVGPNHHRDVRIARWRDPEHPLQRQVGRGDRQQVGTATTSVTP